MALDFDSDLDFDLIWILDFDLDFDSILAGFGLIWLGFWSIIARIALIALMGGPRRS